MTISFCFVSDKVFLDVMRVVWLVCLASQLTRDGHISALPKENRVTYQEANSWSSPSFTSGVTRTYSDAINFPNQKIRHKTIALELVNRTELSDHPGSDKEVILARAVPLRTNRTKSNLDKLSLAFENK